jgi:hypothetical protein
MTHTLETVLGAMRRDEAAHGPAVPIASSNARTVRVRYRDGDRNAYGTPDDRRDFAAINRAIVAASSTASVGPYQP